MRILVINEKIPSPDTRGAALAVFDLYIRRFLDEGHHVLHIVFAGPDHEFGPELVAHRRRMEAEKRYTILAEEVPRNLRAFLQDRKSQPISISNSVTAAAKDFGADVIVCFDIEAVRFARIAKLPPDVVWLGDLAFQVQLHHYLEDTRHRPVDRLRRFPRTIIWCLVWAVYYAWALRDVPTLIVCAKSSERVLKRLGLQSRYLPFPWPDLPPPIPAPTGDNIPKFLFFGSLSGLGSKSAIDFLAKEVLPVLLRHRTLHSARVFVAGFQPPEELSAKLSKSPQVEMVGYVENLAELMSRCHGIIFPIEVPVGNRTRVITAMSAAQVIIAHENVALGNPGLRHGDNCLLADSGEEFVRQMELAYLSNDSLSHLRDNARASYLELFSPKRATEVFLREIRAFDRSIVQGQSCKNDNPCP